MKPPPEPVQHLMCRFLTRSGLEASAASCGAEAMQALTESSPSLVLMDWDLGGLELLEAMAQKCPEAPALVVSGYLPDPRAMHAPNFAGWRTKPFSRQELCQAVQAALRQRK